MGVIKLIGRVIKGVAKTVAKSPGKIAGGVATAGGVLGYDPSAGIAEQITARNEATSASFREGAGDLAERISTGGKGESALQNIGAGLADVATIASMPLEVAGNVAGTAIGAAANAVSPYVQEVGEGAVKQGVELQKASTTQNSDFVGPVIESADQTKGSLGTVIDTVTNAVKRTTSEVNTPEVSEAVKATEQATAWGVANELFGDISAAGANMLSMGAAAGTNVLGMGQTSSYSGSTAPSETPTQTTSTSAADLAKARTQTSTATVAPEPVSAAAVNNTANGAGVTASSASDLTAHEQDLMAAAKGSGLSETVIRRELMKRRAEKYGSTDLPEDE